MVQVSKEKHIFHIYTDTPIPNISIEIHAHTCIGMDKGRLLNQLEARTAGRCSCGAGGACHPGPGGIIGSSIFQRDGEAGVGMKAGEKF